MNLHEFLSQADLVFNEGGDSCDFGCSDNDVSEMITYVKDNFPDYPYCTISNWVWMDIEAPKETKEKFEKRGLKLCAIYAHEVIEDEPNRGFSSVKTTFLKGFHKNCIFLTQNTAYILKRPGTRISLDAEVFLSIFLG